MILYLFINISVYREKIGRLPNLVNEWTVCNAIDKSGTLSVSV